LSSRIGVASAEPENDLMLLPVCQVESHLDRGAWIQPSANFA
jgi:hypothetical protein